MDGLKVLRTRLNLREDQCTGAAKKKATHLVQEETGFRPFAIGIFFTLVPGMLPVTWIIEPHCMA